MLSNCGIGEDFWESPGLQGDQGSQLRKSVLNICWKDWCWSWSSNTLATQLEDLTHWKRPWCWERLRAGGKGMTEDEMAGWHHQLDGRELEWTPGDGDGQGGVLQFMGLQRVGHNWATELNWTDSSFTCLSRVILVFAHLKSARTFSLTSFNLSHMEYIFRASLLW